MRIELDHVSKRFAAVTALDDVCVDVPAGRRVALIGPNGSGKSTMTRAIMGLIAHAGAVRLDGRPPFHRRAELAARLAYVPQVAPQMAATVGEIAATVSSLRGLPADQVAGVAAELGLDLARLRRTPFRGLSGGTKQKLLIALALAAGPELLVLDEPTASLDPWARARFAALQRELAPRATVVLCSHRLEEIRALVDHVVALDDGKVVYDGPAVDYLEARVASVLELLVDGEAPAWLADHGFTAQAGGWWTRSASQAEKMRLLPAAVAALGAGLRNLTVRDLDLVEVEESHA
ncbi:MAG TPA: ABC transporter ATP-binding protein [Kofleriaceae bacterium]|nr:ABC transporter ATP-binding protein [Kofleriaceae bacterium]